MNKMEKTYILTTASLSTIDKDIIKSDKLLSKYQDMEHITLETQRDLMKIVAVLLSTGENKNDDFFLKEEVLPVRNTGAHKPLNMEHKDSEIVGHMLRTYVTLKNGDIIPNESNNVPEDFDITSESVLYKFVFPELAESVKERARNNKLFVSVEVWFKDYDYLVGNQIVRRNKTTASVLDEILRINGGDGKYKGQKVYRVLRKMLIGGIGIVEYPANPESIIKSVSNLQELDVVNIDRKIADNIIGEIPVKKAVAKDNSVEEELSMVDYKLLWEEAQAANKFKEAGNRESQALAQEREVCLDVISEETRKKWEAEDIQKTRILVIREEEIEVLKAQNGALDNKVKGFVQEKVMTDRLQVLMTELNITEEVAQEKNKLYAKLNDEEFVARINDVKSYMDSTSDQKGEFVKAEENKEEPTEKAEPAAEKIENKSTDVKGGDEKKVIEKAPVVDEIPNVEDGKKVDTPLDLKSDEKPTGAILTEKFGNVFRKYYVPQEQK